MALAAPACIDAMPAADNASCVLVTTSTLAGSAAAALGRAVAVAGAARARLTRARPTLLLLIQPLLRPVSRCCTARGLDLTHLRRPFYHLPGTESKEFSKQKRRYFCSDRDYARRS